MLQNISYYVMGMPEVHINLVWNNKQIGYHYINMPISGLRCYVKSLHFYFLRLLRICIRYRSFLDLVFNSKTRMTYMWDTRRILPPSGPLIFKILLLHSKYL